MTVLRVSHKCDAASSTHRRMVFCYAALMRIVGQRACARPKPTVRVYRTADGSVAAELDAPVSCDAAWSGDGRVALTSNGQDESIVWNTTDWTRRVTLRGDLGGNTTSFGLSADGRRAVIAHSNKVDLVSTDDGRVLLSLTAPGAASFAVAARFLPDDRRIATMWPDGRLDVYDPAALLEQLAELGL